MDVYQTEEEQLEALKKFWKEYGALILGTVLAVVLTSSGYRYWMQKNNTTAEQASNAYTQLIAASAEDNASDVEIFSKQLMVEYAKTPYASLAALTQAKQNVKAADYDHALVNLNWVMDNAKDPALQQIARIRAARVLQSQDKSEQALQTLAEVDAPNFLSLIAEVRGDIFLAQGKKTEARNAYAQALQSSPSSAGIRPLLKMKLDDLTSPESLLESKVVANLPGNNA